jgi:sterol desaturase/sphingolipid hydroxylase (fatty acid hydroxylase superfamily)
MLRDVTPKAALLERVLSELLAPFQSWETVIASSTGVITSVTDLSSKTGWLYLLSSLVIGWLIYRSARRRGLVEGHRSLGRFLFPADVYRQRSAIVDYKFVFVDLSIKAFVYSPFMAGFSWLIYKAVHPMFATLVVFDVSAAAPLTRSIVLTVMGFLMADFGFFFAHYLMHKSRVLWPFHEVHHSAEVLTPVTVYRVHPVEEVINGCVAAVVGAVGAATYAAVAGKDVGIITLFGTNVIMFVFFVFAFQLRHSHVWLSYGPVLSRIFISPAQHQIHHSLDARHWDKNYGFVLAVWDLAFRSLYVPRSRETLRFGTGTDPRDFSSVSKLYCLPFVKAARTIVQWRPWAGRPGEAPRPAARGAGEQLRLP